MGNNKSSNYNTRSYRSKPTDIQMKQSIETLRAYHRNVTLNDKYYHPIDKFLNEIDNISSKNKQNLTIGNFLKQNSIYDSNIEYMLKLQHTKHYKDLSTYTQTQWDELYVFCTIKSTKTQAKQFKDLMQNKMTKLARLINEISNTPIQINNKTIKQKKSKKKRKKLSKARRKKSNKKTETTSSKSSQLQPVDDSLLSEQNKEFSYKEILVYGYIRDVGEKFLINIIIPIDICHLCLKYFSHNEIFLLHISTGTFASVCIKVRNNFYTSHEMRILELNKAQQDSTELINDKWRIENSSLYCKQNIKLPAAITTKLNDAYNKYYKSYDKDYYTHGLADRYSIIFNRGDGHAYDHRDLWYKKCYAICFNDRELYKSDTSKIVGFKYSLPNCKRELSSLLYSERYGLIAVGGGISIYNLSFRNKEFHSQNKKEWKWLSFGHLQKRRKLFSTVMLDAKRLMVVGGDKLSDPTSELIDLSGHRNKRTMETECNGARCKAGVLYDNYNKRVFVGGGRSIKTKAIDEFYDVVKDKWYIYAQCDVNNVIYGYNNTNVNNYGNWPILYSTDNEVIFITNGYGSVKYTDLRENTQKWENYSPNIQLKNVLHYRSYRVVS